MGGEGARREGGLLKGSGPGRIPCIATILLEYPAACEAKEVWALISPVMQSVQKAQKALAGSGKNS